MKLSNLLITTTLALMLPATAALAGGKHGKGHGIGQRLDRQEMRIEQGIRSGALTRYESKKLRKKHRRVAHLYHDYRDNGRLSKQEKRRLNRKLDRVSDSIYKLKHNEHRRLAGHRGYGHHRGWQSHHRSKGDYIAFGDSGIRVVLRFND